METPAENQTETNNPWTTLSSQTVYENPWVEISHREVLNPAGKPGIYGVVHLKNQAIGIVPLDEEGYTWLVGQYRYPLDRYSWEIPEGGGPWGADPLESAKRELIEETGIRASRWDKLLEVDISNSITDEQGVIYLARDLSFGASEPEDTEDLRLRRLPFQEALKMVLQGEIRDSLSMLALMRIKIMMDQGEL